MLTCHNLAYHGWVPRADVAGQLDLPASVGAPDGVDLLREGILAADIVNTVSPTYARESLTPEYGAGVDDACARWATATWGSSTASTPSSGIRPRTRTCPRATRRRTWPARRPAGRTCAPSFGLDPRRAALRHGQPARPAEGLRPRGRGRARADRRRCSRSASSEPAITHSSPACVRWPPGRRARRGRGPLRSGRGAPHLRRRRCRS